MLLRVFFFSAVDVLAALCLGKELIDKNLVGPRDSVWAVWRREKSVVSYVRSVDTASTELYRRPCFECFVTTVIFIKSAIKCLYIPFGLSFFLLPSLLSPH